MFDLTCTQRETPFAWHGVAWLGLAWSRTSAEQEAVNFVREHLVEDPDLSLAAKELTKHALAEGSVDNVSVVIVWLQGNHWRTSQSSPSMPVDIAFDQHLPPD